MKSTNLCTEIIILVSEKGSYVTKVIVLVVRWRVANQIKSLFDTNTIIHL